MLASSQSNKNFLVFLWCKSNGSSEGEWSLGANVEYTRKSVNCVSRLFSLFLSKSTKLNTFDGGEKAAT